LNADASFPSGHDYQPAPVIAMQAKRAGPQRTNSIAAPKTRFPKIRLCPGELSFRIIVIGGKFVILSGTNQITSDTFTMLNTNTIVELSSKKILIDSKSAILLRVNQINSATLTETKTICILHLSLSKIMIGGKAVWSARIVPTR
jgi:hypothetical protein